MSVKRLTKVLGILALLAILVPSNVVVAAEPVAGVHIAGKAAGFLPAPCNCPDNLILAINAVGSETALEGSGVIHASTGLTVRFSVAGSVAGTVVHLAGTFTDSPRFPPLIGTPIEIDGDAATGTLMIIIGPFAGGLFAGETSTYAGTGTIAVTGG